ncbi:unnamed protein product [Dovyalis caffra]|uniref:Pectinesterase n=1 Tax=Dovyalis caffra TaxID=77055 RepID=A0AAV1SQY7_9ROSI|nr:unnamed protein product [Dovyalis caffra]
MAQDKQSLTETSDSGNHISIFKKNKRLFLAIFATLLLVATIVAVVTGVNSHKNSKNEGTHAILKSSCSSTLYPELCYSAIATVPGATSNLASQKDVIELSINLTTKVVQHNFFTVEKLIATRKLTKREKTALHDCLETIDETLDELHEALVDLNEYPNKKSLKQHADDLKTLLSSAITNQETCLDGFSHEDADKKVREALLKGESHVEKMCSNVLAMIKNMTDTDIANELKTTNRKLKEEKDGDESVWPEWMSVADRRLLQSSSVTPNVVVAADGSGNYKTVSAAVAAAPQKSSKRYIIRIKAGVYRENVEVPKNLHNIMFLGDGRKTTIITGSRNVVDGSTTFNSATVGNNASPHFLYIFFHTHPYTYPKMGSIVAKFREGTRTFVIIDADLVESMHFQHDMTIKVFPNSHDTAIVLGVGGIMHFGRASFSLTVIDFAA